MKSKLSSIPFRIYLRLRNPREYKRARDFSRLWKRVRGSPDHENSEFLRALTAIFSNSAHYAPWWGECSGVFWHEHGAMIFVKRAFDEWRRHCCTRKITWEERASRWVPLFFHHDPANLRLGYVFSNLASRNIPPRWSPECAAFSTTNNTILRKEPGIRVLSNRGLKEPFSLVNDACRRMSLFLSSFLSGMWTSRGSCCVSTIASSATGSDESL